MLKRLLLALTLSLAALRGQASVLPEGLPSQPADPVTDQAGMLDGGQRERLNQVLRGVWDQGRGPQVAVLTLKSLDGRPIEDVALNVARGWGLGGKETDNGVLLLIARNDRKLRIEVGTKLEGVLTDIACQRIIADVMTPLLRQGDSGAAISAGVAQILERIAPESAAQAETPPQQRSQASPRSILRILFYVVVFIVYLWFRMRIGWLMPRGRRGIGGGWGGGGWGSGGGGGFGGGGGGFSGGGSSGSW